MVRLRTALPWGAGTGLAAFVPVLVGLLTADPPPGPLAWALGVAGGAVAGVVGGAQAVVGERARRRRDELSAQLEAEVARLDQNNLELEIARAQSNEALGAAGALLLPILLQRSREALDRHLRFLLESLHDALSSRGELSVAFLQYHGDPAFGLPPPVVRADGRPDVVLTVREQVAPPHLISQWLVERGSDDHTVAARMLAGEPPWRDGLLIRDATEQIWHRHAVLRMHPAPEVASYCRVPLQLDGQPLGLLCLDAVSPGALTVEDYEQMIQPFALAVTSGFGVYSRAVDAPTGEHRG